MTCPSRPLLRWHGGKWRLAQWIIAHFPPHRSYIEPFGGAGSVLLRKPRSDAELINDLDGQLVNLYQVLRSERAGELVQQIALTPFAREELRNALLPSEDPVEQARRTIARSFMSFGSNGVNHQSGFRADTSRLGGSPAREWANYPENLAAVIERLRGVGIESRPAARVIESHDSSDTLFYVDPPYVSETRGNCVGYAHEMTLDQHEQMIDQLLSVEGKVLVSGYTHELYETWLSDWFRAERTARADGGRERTEVLWMNFDPRETPAPGGLFELAAEAAQ